jgi:hypothetical protein
MPTGLSVIQFRDLYRGDWALDWDSATASLYKCALFGAKTIDFSAALLYGTSPLNTGEQAGSGYTAGGMNVPGRTVVETAASSGIIAFTATYMEWNPITTSTVRNAVIYRTTDGGGGTNKVLGVWDLGTPADVTAGVFRITFVSDRVVTHKVIP